MTDSIAPACPSLKCGHPGCVQARNLAWCRCSHCAREIGFGTPFIRNTYAPTLAHAVCAGTNFEGTSS